MRAESPSLSVIPFDLHAEPKCGLPPDHTLRMDSTHLMSTKRRRSSQDLYHLKRDLAFLQPPLPCTLQKIIQASNAFLGGTSASLRASACSFCRLSFCWLALRAHVGVTSICLGVKRISRLAPANCTCGTRDLCDRPWKRSDYLTR